MNEIEIIRKLASISKTARIPDVDVSGNVAAVITEPDGRLSDAPLAWIAGLSFSAAVPICVFAMQALDILTDPLANVFWTFKWVTLI